MCLDLQKRNFQKNKTSKGLAEPLWEGLGSLWCFLISKWNLRGIAELWAGNYRDRKLNLGKMYLVPQFLGNLIPSFLQDSSL